MLRHQDTRNAFTLVEILIVVIILGILAAIVIPQFTNASAEAKSSSLVTQLQTLRSQLAVYEAQHNDNAPDVATFWDQLTKYTDISGATSDAKDATHIYGPYLPGAVSNPLNDQNSVAAAPALTVGWVWDATAKKITATNKTATSLFDETTKTVQ